MCFIETKNLDGETNLKHKFVHKDLLNFYNNDLEVLYHFLKIISKLFSYSKNLQLINMKTLTHICMHLQEAMKSKQVKGKNK